jgi:hypothetical protein
VQFAKFIKIHQRMVVGMQQGIAKTDILDPALRVFAAVDACRSNVLMGKYEDVLSNRRHAKASRNILKTTRILSTCCDRP